LSTRIDAIAAGRAECDGGTQIAEADFRSDVTQTCHSYHARAVCRHGRLATVVAG